MQFFFKKSVVTGKSGKSKHIRISTRGKKTTTPTAAAKKRLILLLLLLQLLLLPGRFVIWKATHPSIIN
ncbi:hypothetical protein IV203_002227 [Nitzschia inconspicua]|uniref:Uncharacterized protein n=1 Tax=Nitzschia inconspicua TaxID=303405 RepID=A0A9K3PUF9_9STRA|nr:hypothetical protein IV203_002227 [Nitzschia inconspicua]